MAVINSPLNDFQLVRFYQQFFLFLGFFLFIICVYSIWQRKSQFSNVIRSLKLPEKLQAENLNRIPVNDQQLGSSFSTLSEQERLNCLRIKENLKSMIASLPTVVSYQNQHNRSEKMKKNQLHNTDNHQETSGEYCQCDQYCDNRRKSQVRNLLPTRKDFILDLDSSVNSDDKKTKKKTQFIENFVGIKETKIITNYEKDNNRQSCDIDLHQTYHPSKRKLRINIMQIRNFKYEIQLSKVIFFYLKVAILPSMKPIFKTKPITINSQMSIYDIDECFTFNGIKPENILGCSLRLQLFCFERAKKKKLLADGILTFIDSKPLLQETLVNVELRFRDEFVKSKANDYHSNGHIMQLTESRTDIINFPQLLISLTYNGITGRLQLTLMKGTNLKLLSRNSSNEIFAKILVISSSNQEMFRRKTKARKTTNPVFNETFVFQIINEIFLHFSKLAMFQMRDISILFTIFARKSIRRKVRIGHCSMGCNNSSQIENEHWQEMLKKNGKEIVCWHSLISD